MTLDHYCSTLVDGEDQLAAQVAEQVIKHICPPVLEGFGRGSLSITFQAIMHTFWLISSNPEFLSKVIRAVLVWCTDYGIENGVARVLPVLLSEVFPHIPNIDRRAEPPVPLAVRDDMDGDFAPAPENMEIEFANVAQQPQQSAEHERLYADVTGSVEVPGLLHVLHNLGRGLEHQLKGYKDAVFKLGKVCNVLRRKESKDRLEETCFEPSAAAHLLFKKNVKQFQASCYSERWGTVSVAIMRMTEDLQVTLTHGWDMNKFLAGSSRHAKMKEEENPESEHATRLDIVDEAIRSIAWWSYIKMLQRVARVLHKAFANAIQKRDA